MGDLKDPSKIREGADVDAPLALTSLNSGKSTLASLFPPLDAGRGFGLNVENDGVRIANLACSSSSRSCGLCTASRLLPSLCDLF